MTLGPAPRAALVVTRGKSKNRAGRACVERRPPLAFFLSGWIIACLSARGGFMPFFIRARRPAVVSVADTLFSNPTWFFVVVALAILGSSLLSVPATGVSVQSPAPNSDPTYQALRNLTLSGEAVTVTTFDLKRDAGTFHLHAGTVCFVSP